MTTVAGWLAENRQLARLDAHLLLAHVLQLGRAQIIAHPERILQPPQLCTLQTLAARRSANESLAYITGRHEFWGLELTVSPAVLVPRPETELLVELCIDIAPAGAQVLDLGTGSGAIAIALAHERPDLQVTASDRYANALDVARTNASAHGVRLDLVQSNWLAGLRKRWDVIVSNPPYISPDDPHLADLSAEPIHALVAQDGGLRDLHTIVRDAGDHLQPRGCLMVEHGYDQAAQVREQMAIHGFVRVSSRHDLGDIERVTLGYLEPG